MTLAQLELMLCINPMAQSQLIFPVQCQELPYTPGVAIPFLIVTYSRDTVYAWRCHYDIIIGTHGLIPATTPDILDVYITNGFKTYIIHCLALDSTTFGRILV